MVVMGGIVGSGIFVTPAIVASWTRSRAEMLAAWAVGGVAALLGAFLYADLSRRRPFAGGQYVYLREAFHPAVGFLYGWALLVVIQTGGMAVCAMTFARYFAALAPLPLSEGAVAAAAMAALVAVNCVGVAFACDRALGKEALQRSAAPALDAATRLLGAKGASVIAAGVALSSLGFLSQSILTAPRVYFAMAEDGAFLRAVARVHPRTRAPVAAIALQGAVAIALALAGTYEVLLRYVVAIDFIFFALVASCLFVFQARGEPISMPGHPLTTLLFIGVCAAVVISTFARDPVHALIGLALTLAGLPVYLLWRRSDERLR